MGGLSERQDFHPDAVVLWQEGSASCVVYHHQMAPEFEICVLIERVMIQSKSFYDHNSASAFALEQMALYVSPSVQSSPFLFLFS